MVSGSRIRYFDCVSFFVFGLHIIGDGCRGRFMLGGNRGGCWVGVRVVVISF